MKIKFKKIITTNDHITVFNGKDTLSITENNYETATLDNAAIPIDKNCKDLNELRVFSGPVEFKVRFTQQQQDKISKGTVKVAPMKTTEYNSYNFEKDKSYKVILDQTNMNNLGVVETGNGQAKNQETQIKPMTAIIKNNPNIKSVALASGTTEIKDSAFYYCSNIETIIIPDTVNTIGDAAFLGCNALKSIFIPDSVTCLGNVLFAGCANLVNVRLPSHIKTIGFNLLSGCTAVKTLSIPKKVQTIESAAFMFCGGLTNVTLPKSLKVIENDVFGRCGRLKEITYEGTKKDWGKIKIDPTAFTEKVTIHCTDGDLSI